MTAQTSLFNVTDYTNGKKLKTKRVHYKKPAYRKVYKQYKEEAVNEISYKVLYTLYTEIFNLCEFGFFKHLPDETFEQDGMRVWKIEYTKEQYKYEGEEFDGQEFTCQGAEIIGTEYFPLEKKIKIHTELLRMLRKGFSVKEALKEMKGK